MKRLPHLIKPDTLFGRTALALALAFLLFGLVSTAILQVSLVRPQTRLAADELASFLVLAAQIWVELPPFTRPDYEREMLRRHQLRILPSEAPHPTPPATSSFIDYLETSLRMHIGQAVQIHRHPDHEGWLWADFPMGGRTMRLGFREDRLHNQMALIMPLLAAIGLSIAFVLALLLVRRVTLPLATMAEATRRIGGGRDGPGIPQTGPRELAYLARKLNQMDSRIRRLLENRTTLLAGISHDLRTPLSRMRLELELLRTDENQELVDGLNNNITEMEQLISQALMLARGLGHEKPVEVSICDVLTEVANAFRGAGHAIEIEPAQNDVLQIPINALKRIVGNLVDNALIYGGEQVVTLTCSSVADGITVTVVDRGPGIPASEREKIFEPFYRLEGSRSRSTGGSGLGLAVVQQLCQANGWEISVAPAPGQGARFSLFLPRYPDSPPESTSS